LPSRLALPITAARPARAEQGVAIRTTPDKAPLGAGGLTPLPRQGAAASPGR